MNYNFHGIYTRRGWLRWLQLNRLQMVLGCVATPVCVREGVVYETWAGTRLVHTSTSDRLFGAKSQRSEPEKNARLSSLAGLLPCWGFLPLSSDGVWSGVCVLLRPSERKHSSFLRRLGGSTILFGASQW